MRDPRSVTGKGEKRERGTGLGEVGRCELPACEKLRGRSGPGAAERGKRERRRLRAPPGPGVVGAGAAARFPGPCSHACGWGDEAGARRLHRLPGGKARWNRASSSAPAIGGPRAALAGPGGREEPLVSGRRAAPGFDRGRRGTARPPPQSPPRREWVRARLRPRPSPPGAAPRPLALPSRGPAPAGGGGRRSSAGRAGPRGGGAGGDSRPSPRPAPGPPPACLPPLPPARPDKVLASAAVPRAAAAARARRRPSSRRARGESRAPFRGRSRARRPGLATCADDGGSRTRSPPR